MKIVLIDNYDSFTYNLRNLVLELGVNVDVVKNDAFQLEELESYDGILLSPGPGLPKEAGLLLNVIKTYANKKPILGVCLGEQAIAEAFGGKLANLNEVFHGIQSEISCSKDDPLFKGLPQEILVGRYHSWVVSPENFPSCLQITATSKEGHIMAIRHRNLPVMGIQFHPESVLTLDGKAILANWFQIFNICTSVKKN